MIFYFRGSDGAYALYGPKGNVISNVFTGTRRIALEQAKHWASTWPTALIKEEENVAP